MRVVVDPTDNEVLYPKNEGEGLPYDLDDLRARLLATVQDVAGTDRLIQVDAILPGRPPLTVSRQADHDGSRLLSSRRRHPAEWPRV